LHAVDAPGVHAPPNVGFATQPPSPSATYESTLGASCDAPFPPSFVDPPPSREVPRDSVVEPPHAAASAETRPTTPATEATEATEATRESE